MHSTELDTHLRRARREPLWRPGPATRAVDVRGDALHPLLPHRPPFLFVDAITAVDGDQRALAARRRIDPADPVLAGHFPGAPVYPGVLLVETMAQAAACVVPLLESMPAIPTFFAATKAVFLAPVLPGDTLEILVVCLGAYDGLYARSVGQVRRDGKVCAAAIIEGAHVP